MKRLPLLLFLMTLLASTFMLPAYAQTVTQDGLEVTLQTNNDIYDISEPIQISVEIKNNNEDAVANVAVSPYASQPYALSDSAQSTVNIGILPGNGTAKINAAFVRNADGAASLPVTGDSSHPVMWMICLALSLSLAYILRKKKMGIRMMSLFLCLCVLASVFPMFSTESASAEPLSLVVEKTVSVAGESVTVGVKVTYSNNAEANASLSANTNTILQNNSAYPVYFYVQTNSEYETVELINNKTDLPLSNMFDDGRYSESGDDLPGDGIYSCKINIPAAQTGKHIYYARLTDASGSTFVTNQVEITVVSEFAEAELAAINQVHDSLGDLVSSSAYQHMSIDQRAQAVAAQLQMHVKNGLVDPNSIKYDANNQLYTFRHASGALGGTMLAPFNQNLNGSAAMTRTERETAALSQSQVKPMMFRLARSMKPTETVNVGNAAIYYAFDDTVSSERFPHYTLMASQWSDRGLNTQLNNTVTVEDLKSIDDYNVVVLSMHGVYYQSDVKSGPVLCLLEEVSEEKNLQYSSDLKKHNLATVTVDGGETRYWVYGSFFEDHYGANDLQNTFIFSEACSFWGENSSSDKSIAEALEKADAAAVIGFYNPVYTQYSRDMMQHYVNSLLDGKTAYEALNAGKEKYGSDDSKYAEGENNSVFSAFKDAAYALFGGSTNSKLIESGLKNTGFEQSSSAAGWNTTGDVRVLTKLGSLSPTGGNRMAILTTGIGSQESNYLEGTEGSILSQKIVLPSNVGSIQFSYNVVSEEPMEFVDSMFDDRFVVRILNASGNVCEERMMESVNESTWYPISGINFESGDDTTYHTKWKTGVIDVSDYQNKTITLQFVVYDMGDSIYDTAALIDDVKLFTGSGPAMEECSLHLSPSTWTPILIGESKTVSVTKHGSSSFSVKVKQLDLNGDDLDSANKWLTATKSGNNIKLTAAANYAAQPRTATVSVSCACGETKKLIVTQMSGAPKPTSKVTLQSSDAKYTITGTGNDYTDRFALNNAGNDTLYVKVDGTYVGRIFATLKQVGGEGNTLPSQSKEFSPTQGSASATLSFAIPKDTPDGTYRCTVYVSNSAIPNAAYKQNADTIEFDIIIKDSSVDANRNKIVAHAEKWLTTYFPAAGMPYYIKGVNAKYIDSTSKYKYHGMPYVGGGYLDVDSDEKYDDRIDTTYSSTRNRLSLSYYENKLSDTERKKVYDKYYYYFGGWTRSAYCGTECVGFVLQCLSQIDSTIDISETLTGATTGKAYRHKLTKEFYNQVKPGDVLAKSGHVMLVIDNSGSSITVIEQTTNSGGFVECQCENCTKDGSIIKSLGTRQYTYSYTGNTLPKYTHVYRMDACMDSDNMDGWERYKKGQ